MDKGKIQKVVDKFIFKLNQCGRLIKIQYSHDIRNETQTSVIIA